MADRGRKVRIVARRGPAGPVALAVTVVAATACGSNVTLPAGQGGAGGDGGAGGTTVTTSSSSGGTGGTGGGFNPTGTGAGPEGPCDFNPEIDFVVEVPPEGTPADPGQICAVMMGAVESNTAARVTLQKDPQELHLATGEIVIDPALLPDVVGMPQVTVENSPLSSLQMMATANYQPTATGFTFDVAFPSNLNVGPFEESMMILKTTFFLSCPGNSTKQVEALTHVNLCIDDAEDVAWVSSGDECTICGIIAEMAPSPVVPDHAGDDIGLGRVIKLRLVILGRIGDTLVLLAEHDGGEGLDYDWVASGGEVQRVAPDVVAWTPPVEGAPHLLQVAVHHDDGAAVASYTAVPVREAGLVA